MADSEQVLTLLEPPEKLEIIGIVVNARGAERAIETGTVQTLGFPYSISPEFLKRNQNQTLEESLEVLEEIGTMAYKARMDLVAYVSMAFGNPYGDAWSVDEVGVWMRMRSAGKVRVCGKSPWQIRWALRLQSKSSETLDKGVDGHTTASRLVCIYTRDRTKRPRKFCAAYARWMQAI